MAVPISDIGGEPDAIRSREEFGEALTDLRRRALLGVRQAAKLADIPAATVSDYLRGNTIPQPGGLAAFKRLLGVLGVPEENIPRWCELAERLRTRPGPRPGRDDGPYRGLAPFSVEDAGWFFGRDAVSEQILDRLEHRAVDGGPPLFVLGSSGAGKSSVIQAGVMAAIRTNEFDVRSGRRWRTKLMSPGVAPRANLTACLEDLPAGDAQNDAGQGFVLVVDQYEELFTTDVAEAERRWFIETVTDLAGSMWDGYVHVLVILVMRADFFQRASDYPLLAEAMSEGPVVVGAMSTQELSEVVTGPADKGEVKIQHGLLEVLLGEVTRTTSPDESDAGALPLLSHALRMTWEGRERNQLTVKAYNATGGIRKAVAQTAEQVFIELGSDERALARNIFLRLVHTDDGVPDTRRRVTLNELADFDESRTTRAVLDRFVRGRLLTVSEDGVQITHEALLSAWPRLETWLNKDREGHTLHRRLAAAARVWTNSGESSDHLYRGSVLESVRDLGTRMAGRITLNTLERGFLNASIDYERQQQSLLRRRVRIRRTLWATAALVVVVLSATVTYAVTQTVANDRERVVTQSRDLAVQADRFRRSDVSLAAQLALVAYEISPTPQARASVLDAAAEPLATRMVGPLSVLQAVAVSPTGRYVATAGARGEIRTWDVTNRGRPTAVGRPLQVGAGTLFALTYSPRGDLLLAGGADGKVRVWRTGGDTGMSPAKGILTGMQNTVYAIAFDPSGRFVAVGSADNTVRLFDLADPDRPVAVGEPLTGFTGYVQSVAFSQDGRLLAGGSADRTVRLWDVADMTRPVVQATLPAASGRVYATAFSTDGRTLAVGDSEKAVTLWNVSDPARPAPVGAPFTEATGRINTLAFAPDNELVAIGSSDSSVRIWNRSTGRVVTVLPHPGPVTDVEFLDGGRRLVTVAADGVTRLWLVPGQRIGDRAKSVFSLSYAKPGELLAVSSGQAANSVELWETTDHFQVRRRGQEITATGNAGAFVGSVALSPDGRTLASGTDDGTVELFDVTNPAAPNSRGAPLRVGSTIIQSVVFSQDSTLLAAAGDDMTVGLWDVSSGSPKEIGVLSGATNSVFSLAFSGDGRLLAAGSLDGKVWLWDLSETEPRLLPPLGGFSSYVHTVAFSPHGRILAAGSADKTVQMWDLRDPAKPASTGTPLVGPTNYVYSVAFSPDGQVLAAGSSDRTVWLWNVATPAKPNWLATLSAAKDTVFVVAFSHDGHTLAAGTAERAVRLWWTDPNDAAAMICATVGDRISREEWAHYVPERPYAPPC